MGSQRSNIGLSVTRMSLTGSLEQFHDDYNGGDNDYNDHYDDHNHHLYYDHNHHLYYDHNHHLYDDHDDNNEFSHENVLDRPPSFLYNLYYTIYDNNDGHHDIFDDDKTQIFSMSYQFSF